MSKISPFSHNFDLAALPAGGHEERLAVPPEIRASIAEWCEVDAVEDLTASFRLSRLSADEYALDAHFDASVLQTCIVSLAPLRSRVSRDFTRRYRVLPAVRARRPAQAAPAAADDEIEQLRGSSLDLAAPLLEELSLAIDPYPRAPGAVFSAPKDEDESRDGPFAILKVLKEPGPLRPKPRKR